VKCALLGWMAFKDAVARAENGAAENGAAGTVEPEEATT
jgi:nitrogen fixation NifU-like protein